MATASLIQQFTPDLEVHADLRNVCLNHQKEKRRNSRRLSYLRACMAIVNVELSAGPGIACLACRDFRNAA